MCSNATVLFQTPSSYCVTLQDVLTNTVLVLLGLVIISLNSWILWVLFINRGRMDQINQFIVNLATCDLLIGVFVMYDVFYNMFQFKIFVECMLREGFFISVNLASVWTLASLTCDRYLKIQHPFTYIKRFSKKRVQVILAVLWIMAFGIGTCPFFGWNTEDIWQICNFFGTMEKSYITFIMVLFAVPFLIMICAYIRIAKTAFVHLKAIQKMECHSRDVPFCLHSWKAAKMAILIVGAYLICWSPVGFFIAIVYTTDIELSLSPLMSENVIFTYLLGIGIFNSILNPLIYASNLDMVRKSAKNCWLVTCCRKLLTTTSTPVRPVTLRSDVSQETDNTRVSDCV
ncbi:adenosine receptor A3-like [Mizuhopecten yessoensis]|uniref:Adenosine receptor A2b n=1 Tax=Mizuhopecten yessoensis TaxID=6573 RepID=A0A210R4U0_MIZYE|nr:adenosine receptor A3-like [Mizuhopecten yessoensis]OWF56032.1 Adenosine receptor A2b [Mizuhopecten yessoensis]